MSNDEKSPSELNLLLKQQKVNDLENRYEIKYETLRVESFEEITIGEEDLNSEKNDLTLTLTKCQDEENSSYSNLRSVWDQQQLLRASLQRIYHYFTCAKLTMKAAKELGDMLVECGVQKDGETFQEMENDRLEESSLELIHDNEIRTMWNELEARKKDYDIATKNFKILLEIIDFSWDELEALKKQYDDVFLKYRKVKDEMEEVLPILAEKMKTILFECLQSLGGNVEEVAKSSVALYDLIKSVSLNKESDDE